MVMVMRSVMERCSPEWRRRQPGGGGGYSPAAETLGPPSSLEMVLVWRRFSCPRRLPRRKKFMVA